MGGLQIARTQWDGLCRTMTFSRGVQTPEGTMTVSLLHYSHGKVSAWCHHSAVGSVLFQDIYKFASKTF